VHNDDEKDKPGEEIQDKREKLVAAALKSAQESLLRPFLQSGEDRGEEDVDWGDRTADPCRDSSDVVTIFAVGRRLRRRWGLEG
jgi:hypothetical protein